MGTILSVARLSLTDRVRDRRLLVAELVPSLLLLGLLVVMSTTMGNADRGGDDRRSFTIGLSGDLTAVDGLADDLAARHFEIVPVEDPVRSVLHDQVEAVLVLDGADLADATVVDRSGNDGSRVTGLLLRAAIADHVRAAAGGAPVEAVQQAPEQREPPEALALVVAFLPLFFAAGAGRAVHEHLTGERDAGTLEVQLSLPIDRRALLGGHCLAELLAALAKEGLLLGPGVLAVAAVGAVERGPLVGVGVGALALVAVLAQAAVMALVGVLAAAGNAVCRAIVHGPWMLVTMVLLLWSRGEPGPLPEALAAIPGAGLAVGVREVIVGHPAGPALVLGVTATAAGIAMLVRRAVRALESEALSMVATSQ
ncbi:MAG: ABC transporter permease subunit [Acidimicrobiales bacterium]